MNSLVFSKQLLWKDFNQLKPAMIACWVLLVSILLLAFVRQVTAIHRETIIADSLMLVLVAPTLMAMAASGILIGHERQTRTWNWSSSLPVSWSSTLISKTIVWFLASVAMVLSLLLVYFVLLQICRWQGFSQDPVPDWITFQIVLSSVLVIPVIVYVCFSLAALLWNDTLTAFVVAAVVVSILYFLTVDTIPRALLDMSWNQNLGTNGEVLAICLQLGLLLVGAGIVMMLAYRWRWTSGQMASISWGSRFVAPLNNVQRQIAWQGAGWSGSPSSEFQMLLTHALRVTLGARILIVVGSLFMGWLMSGEASGGGPLLVTSYFGIALLGVTTFATDQAQSSYRFFADRGVRWQRFLVAHCLPPAVLATAMFVFAFALAVAMSTDLLVVWESVELYTLFGLLLFATGVFCSLCARISLLSICMTAGAVILAVMAMIALENSWRGVVNVQLPRSAVVMILFIELVIVVVAISLLIRRWLVKDRVLGAAYYVTTLILAIVPSHLIAASLCFLAIPNVPWQGANANQIRVASVKPAVAVDLPDLNLLSHRFYSYDQHQLRAEIEYGLDSLDNSFISQANKERPAQAQPEQQLGDDNSAEEVAARQAAILDGLASLEKSLAAVDLTDATYKGPYARLDPIIMSTAWIGLYATERLNDVELARRAWKINAQLCDLVDYTVLDSEHVLYSRIASVMMKTYLSDGDWAQLRTGGSLAELQPKPIDTETLANLARMQATLWREQLRKDPLTRWLLPLRWYREREIALTLQQQLQLLYGQPVSPAPTALAAPHKHPLVQMINFERGLPRE